MTSCLSKMSRSLPLLKGSITLEDALTEDSDVLHELSYPEKRLDFYVYLSEHRQHLEELVSFHLGVPKETCKAARDFREWVHGSFNACVPVYVDETAKCRVKKSQFPGNAEEKLRCEVATYIWIENNCPDISIPRLRGFGFPSGRCFTALENKPILRRIAWFFQRTTLWLFGYPTPSQYIGRQSPFSPDSGYLIVDCVEEGEMLSESWNLLHHDRKRRANLFAGLSRIMLSLARVPFPRIGPLTIDNCGVLSLACRPLTCILQQLENFGIPTDIPKDRTYVTADARIRYMPNSIHNTLDGQAQLSALTMMRSLLPHFTDRDLRWGPFILMLTDLHQSNIFVSNDWHVTAIIDLEWACALPIEMLHPPYWLTGVAIDRIVEEELEIMRKGWEIGNFWYFSALDCLNGLYSLYMSHIQRIFAATEDSGPKFDRTVSAYWTANTAEFIAAKVRDKEVYSSQLRECPKLIRLPAESSDLSSALSTDQRVHRFGSPEDLSTHFKRKHLQHIKMGQTLEGPVCEMPLDHKQHLRNHALRIHKAVS
ncbi:hypothetical protein BDY21DRAFT_388290 [Lineolata rhizophorae]|uniref:Aminoglycoside phosphotransferase domain-containing protein n=1 Tax=Lineolata rhizophorae TaxID=578093 RepID=A0A6A6NNK7_9PEZI|nr:hypothetical protein BDY21DRAFT_388290 [Lineolata rhizophorae]